MSIHKKEYRNDIHIGAEALRLAVDSFGENGSTSTYHILDRAKAFHSWLMSERKS